jgi:glycosyltransferase involved in cell wall biosynthesis
MISADSVISVIVPVCDGAEALRASLTDVLHVLARHYVHYEVILVDDPSSQTRALAADRFVQELAALRLIRLTRPQGQDVAVLAGLEAAIGDYVVVLRPPFDPPAEIPALVRAAAENHGIVLGVAGGTAAGDLFSWGRRGFYWLLRRFLSVDIPAQATGFCALARPAVNAITRVRLRYRNVRLLAGLIGYPLHCHHYVPLLPLPPRRRTVLGGLSEALTLVAGVSKTPLRVASSLGIAAALLNLLYVLYVVAIYFFKEDVAPGWVTLSLQNAAMFFLVFLNIVLIAEYVGQTLEEAQQRPLYQVLDERNSPLGASRFDGRNVLDQSVETHGEKHAA